MIPTHMDAIHISTARRIMEENEFSVSFLTAAGEIRHIDRAVSLRYDYLSGTRNIKCLFDDRPPNIRRIRDVFIYEINDIEVYI